MKKKHKQKLLIDKKECTNCGHILEKDCKVCDECGYDMTMEESLKAYSKIFNKILNENKVPIINVRGGKATMQNPNPNPERTITDLKTLPKGVYQINVADETQYTMGKDKKLSVGDIDKANLNPGDTIMVADEGKKKKPNPWAICTSSVGRENKKKYERCVMDIKKQHKMDEDLQRLEEYIERLITDSEINPKIKKGNFKQFVSKLK